MDKRTEKLFEKFTFVEGAAVPILRGKVPAAVMAELKKYVAHGKAVRKKKLGFMLAHYNAGENSYQISVPVNQLENSYSLAFLNFLGEIYLSRISLVDQFHLRRTVRLKKNEGHFDGYDFWINFARKGDKNPFHVHSGDFSGVIYFTNKERLPTIFEKGGKVHGKPGEIIIFPADARHCVEETSSNTQRITFAFNLFYTGAPVEELRKIQAKEGHTPAQSMMGMM